MCANGLKRLFLHSNRLPVHSKPHPRLLLELEFQGMAKLGEELGQLLMQITHTFGLNENLWVLQACQGSLDLKECDRLIAGLKGFEEQGRHRFQALA